MSDTGLMIAAYSKVIGEIRIGWLLPFPMQRHISLHFVASDKIGSKMQKATGKTIVFGS